jgi:hypothetical protein
MSVIPHYEPHKLALIFPSIDDQWLDLFAADIKQNGLLNPIVLYEGKILDGVQRQAACERANVYPSYSQFDDLPKWKRKFGPLAFVISQNLHRRHLTVGQRAEIAEQWAKGTHGGDRKSDQELKKAFDPAASDQGEEIPFDRPTIKQAAAMMHVSPDSVKKVRKVKREAPDKIKAIKAGKLSPSKAVSELPAKETKGKGKLLNGDDASKAFDPKEFEKRVSKRLATLVQSFPNRKAELRRLIVTDIIGALYKGDVVAPVKVKFFDDTVFTLKELLQAKTRLRLKSDKSVTPKAVKSHDITAAAGHSTKHVT